MKHQDVLSILEYVPNKLLVHVEPKDFLLIEDWCVVGMIEDSDRGNIEKNFLSLIYGFDLQTFPFVICSGLETWNLINIKEKTIQILIHTPARYYYGQAGAFF